MHLVQDEVGGGLGRADSSEKILGDGVVQLADDTLINNSPLRVAALSGGWRRGQVVAEGEFIDEGVEEAPPLVVVRLGELESDRNMRFDVHSLKDGSGGRHDRRSIAVDGGRGRRISDGGG